MREEEELRRLQGEVHATERRLELREKELRQLNRQAGRLLRQREEAAWHKHGRTVSKERKKTDNPREVSMQRKVKDSLF